MSSWIQILGWQGWKKENDENNKNYKSLVEIVPIVFFVFQVDLEDCRDDTEKSYSPLIDLGFYDNFREICARKGRKQISECFYEFDGYVAAKFIDFS